MRNLLSMVSGGKDKALIVKLLQGITESADRKEAVERLHAAVGQAVFDHGGARNGECNYGKLIEDGVKI